MSDESKRGQEPIFEGMELKHLAIEIEKGLNLSNLAQSINQQMVSSTTTAQSNTSSNNGQVKKE